MSFRSTSSQSHLQCNIITTEGPNASAGLAYSTFNRAGRARGDRSPPTESAGPCSGRLDLVLGLTFEKGDWGCQLQLEEPGQTPGQGQDQQGERLQGEGLHSHQQVYLQSRAGTLSVGANLTSTVVWEHCRSAPKAQEDLMRPKRRQ